MDGELDGKVAQGEEQQVDQAVGEQQPQPSQGSEEVAAGAGADTGADTEAVSEEEYRAALADRDEKVAALEAQVTEAAKTVESAKALTEQIKALKAANDKERIGFDLKIAGARNVTAAKALLAEHGSDVAKLKAAEPWMFVGAAGATCLEPAGASAGADGEMKRWREIAGLE